MPKSTNRPIRGTIKATISVMFEVNSDTSMTDVRANLDEALEKLRELGHAEGEISYPAFVEKL